MKEVEILVKIFENKEIILDRLSEFDYQGKNTILDIYFFDPKRKALKPDKNDHLRACFRLREKNGQAFMTYKSDVFEKTDSWLYSEENEIKVSNLREAENIIEKLGLKRLVQIKNIKHTFLTKKYEIVFEEVEKLGLFLEVEKLVTKDKENIKKTKTEIWKFIKSLGLKVSDEMKIGKPELMLLESQ